MAKKMKGISVCADCTYYSLKKHKCERGCTDEGSARDPFYIDCPLPDVVPWDWLEKYAEGKRLNFASGFIAEAKTEYLREVNTL